MERRSRRRRLTPPRGCQATGRRRAPTGRPRDALPSARCTLSTLRVACGMQNLAGAAKPRRGCFEKQTQGSRVARGSREAPQPPKHSALRQTLAGLRHTKAQKTTARSPQGVTAIPPKRFAIPPELPSRRSGLPFRRICHPAGAVCHSAGAVCCLDVSSLLHAGKCSKVSKGRRPPASLPR